MRYTESQVLRLAFAIGAVIDALAVIPMLSPRMAALVWGFREFGGPYRFAMGYGATLMAAWTGLLVWAYRKPLERRFVAALTVFGIFGLVATEILAVVSGVLPLGRALPTWIGQAVLVGLFAGGYHYDRVSRWVDG